jgi:hypothetical protein
MAMLSAHQAGGCSALRLIATAAVLALSTSMAAAAPAIRSSDANPVPKCVTPARLMAFLAERNPHLDPRYRDIASLYKHFGEAWRVRWDYAFFQMAIETNFLKFRRGDGRRGDVGENQNNFAGIGATGGGVRGERFADVATGVHAQIQHLVAYSGERLAEPIATRTRQRQGDIVEASKRLGRQVTFGDLARRWAVDRAYGKSIDFIAGLYQGEYCAEPTARSAEDLVPPAPQPARRERNFQFPPPSGLGGPKPQGLAGPKAAADVGEQLPWLVAPKKPPVADTEAKPSKKHTSKKTKSPAKAIGSRDTSGRKLKPGAPPPISDDKPTDIAVDGSRSAAPEHSSVEANDAPAARPAPEDGASGGIADLIPKLPTFKIAPEASRLGGPLPADPSAAAKLPSSPPDARCSVLSASYGGTKTLLVRSTILGETRYTVLTVLDGFEKSMFNTYAKAEAPGAQIVGEYPTRDEALADARVNCPGG